MLLLSNRLRLAPVVALAALLLIACSTQPIRSTPDTAQIDAELDVASPAQVMLVSREQTEEFLYANGRSEQAYVDELMRGLATYLIDATQYPLPRDDPWHHASALFGEAASHESKREVLGQIADLIRAYRDQPREREDGIALESLSVSTTYRWSWVPEYSDEERGWMAGPGVEPILAVRDARTLLAPQPQASEPSPLVFVFEASPEPIPVEHPVRISLSFTDEEAFVSTRRTPGCIAIAACAQGRLSAAKVNAHSVGSLGIALGGDGVDEPGARLHGASAKVSVTGLAATGLAIGGRGVGASDPKDEDGFGGPAYVAAVMPLTRGIALGGSATRGHGKASHAGSAVIAFDSASDETRAGSGSPHLSRSADGAPLDSIELPIGKSLPGRLVEKNWSYVTAGDGLDGLAPKASSN